MCEFLDSTNKLTLIQTFSLSKHLHQSLFRLIVLTNCITLTPMTFPLHIYFVLFYGFTIASRLTARRVPCLNPDCCLEWHSEVFFGCWLSFVSLSALIMLKFHIWTHHSTKAVAADFSVQFFSNLAYLISPFPFLRNAFLTVTLPRRPFLMRLQCTDQPDTSLRSCIRPFSGWLSDTVHQL